MSAIGRPRGQQPERAAAVLAGMEPKAAYALSLILAGRNGSVPIE